MRLFTGIALAPAVTNKIAAALKELRPTARIKWTPPENLHITCKFIGAWHEDRLGDLRAALAAVEVARPVPIRISRFGFFPNPRHPHSFFLGVQAGEELTELAASIDRALLRLGLAAETRAYHPHVTLARTKANADIRSLREHIAAMSVFDFGSFDAHEFHLYESKPSAQGSVYTKLATYDLMREKKRTE
jgi:2'-5' RNA ligase